MGYNALLWLSEYGKMGIEPEKEIIEKSIVLSDDMVNAHNKIRALYKNEEEHIASDD